MAELILMKNGKPYKNQKRAQNKRIADLKRLEETLVTDDDEEYKTDEDEDIFKPLEPEPVESKPVEPVESKPVEPVESKPVEPLESVPEIVLYAKEVDFNNLKENYESLSKQLESYKDVRANALDVQRSNEKYQSKLEAMRQQILSQFNV
jgi:hypothetical protein